MSALFDTGVVLDYLRGVKPADAVFERFPHRAVTVTTWVEVMHSAPQRFGRQTRDFLQTFERLAINEAIADRALALMQQHSGLTLRHAIPWATANVNTLIYVTADFPDIRVSADSVWMPYQTGKRAPRR